MMKTGILLRPLLIISILFNIQICADVIDLTDATFELDTKASSGTSSWFLLFKGNSCPHCDRVKPIFEELAEDRDLLNQHGISFGRVDVPSNVLTSSRFSIRSFPTFYFIHNGLLFPFKEERTVESMKSFLINIQTQSNEFYESHDIPPPMSQIDFLYQSYQQILEVATVKGGTLGQLAVQVLFGLAFCTLSLSAILFLYLGYILYKRRKEERSTYEKTK